MDNTSWTYSTILSDHISHTVANVLDPYPGPSKVCVEQGTYFFVFENEHQLSLSLPTVSQGVNKIVWGRETNFGALRATMKKTLQFIYPGVSSLPLLIDLTYLTHEEMPGDRVHKAQGIST